MTAIDNYAHPHGDVSDPSEIHAPARHGIAITAHDTDELTNVTRGLLAYTTAGKCAITTVNDESITIYLALGAVVPVAAKIVKSTGTDAAGITGLY